MTDVLDDARLAGGIAAARPYPGLRPFNADEDAIFFGRERMVDEVLVRLGDLGIVVVHGSSGCGKSSLIAAGVLPLLAKRRARRGMTLRVATFRPGAAPMAHLVGQLASACGRDDEPIAEAEIHRVLASGGAPRAALGAIARDNGIDEVCIVIDQFEELFRFARDGDREEARHFADLLVRLSGQAENDAAWWREPADGETKPGAIAARIGFVITMRSEFLGDCAAFPGLAELVNRSQYLLPNMARADIIRAIREPAELFGGRVEPGLAERMADDASREADALPLVQHALMRMWEIDPDRLLTEADYESALATARGARSVMPRSPLGALLAHHADAVLMSAIGGEERLKRAAEFMFRALCVKDGEGRAVRAPQPFGYLGHLSGVANREAAAILDAFRADGVSFVTPYSSAKRELEVTDIVDISHEALIRIWPRISASELNSRGRPIGWLERETEDATRWRWLAFQAENYRSNPSAILDPITTRGLIPWMETIDARPEWARRHLVRAEGFASVTQEPEWQLVHHLFDASVAKYLHETRDQFWLTKRLARARRWLIAAAVAAVLFGGATLVLALRSQIAAQRAQTALMEAELGAALVRTEELKEKAERMTVAEAMAKEELARANAAQAAAARAGREAEAAQDSAAQARAAEEARRAARAKAAALAKVDAAAGTADIAQQQSVAADRNLKRRVGVVRGGASSEAGAAAEGWWQVVGIRSDDTLAVRAAASVRSARRGGLANGTVVRGLGCRAAAGGRWCLISQPGTDLTGWVSARYLLESGAPR